MAPLHDYTDDDPKNLNPTSLRNIANWFETYDKLAAYYFDLVVEIGCCTEAEVAGARAACKGDTIQRDLRRWADEMEWAEELKGKPR